MHRLESKKKWTTEILQADCQLGSIVPNYILLELWIQLCAEPGSVEMYVSVFLYRDSRGSQIWIWARLNGPHKVQTAPCKVGRTPYNVIFPSMTFQYLSYINRGLYVPMFQFHYRNSLDETFRDILLTSKFVILVVSTLICNGECLMRLELMRL